jgi:predicted membrane protein
MIENKSRTNSRVTLGSILVVIGVLFLVNNLDILSFNIPHVIFSFPTVLLVVGVLILVNSEKKTAGIILVIVGSILLIPRILPSISLNDGVVFSILIIALGIYILTKKRTNYFDSGNYKNSTDSSNDYNQTQPKGYSANIDRIDDVAIFGGGHKLYASDNFRGGNITAIFGGSEIDLTRCKLAKGRNTIEVTAIFGGTTLIVPKEWNVIIDVIPLFGGFSHKGMRSPNIITDPESTLIIKGVVIFGGGEIKTY